MSETIRGMQAAGRQHSEMRRSLDMPARVALPHNPIIKAFGARMKAGGLAPKAVMLPACTSSCIASMAS